MYNIKRTSGKRPAFPLTLGIIIISTMTRKTRTLHLILLFILSLGPAVYFSLLLQSQRYTILDRAFRALPLQFAVLASASFFVLAMIWTSIARREAQVTGQDPGAALKMGFPAFLPLAFFFLSPLALKHYITREDLRTRLAVLGGLVLAGFLSMTFARLRRAPFPGPRPFERFAARFGALPRRKKLVALFLAAFIVYNLAAFILVAQGIEFSGDEPNYLITADSLYYDRDINLANNYADEDWFHFYSKEDHPRLKLGIYGRSGKEGPGHIYPINLPGISFLMLPFYGLSQLVSGKLLAFILKGSLSVWAALLGVQIYLFAAEKWKKERTSLTLWAVYSFAAPVFFYAVHLYPEVPVAFMGLLIYRKVSSDKPLKLFHYLGLGLLLATFFWFGVKYNLIFWPLLLISAYHLWKTHGARLELAAFLAFPLISTAFFYLYVHSLYGTFSPFSIYEGVMTAAQFQAWKRMVLAVPLRERIDAFLDYFLDQRDGLLLYAPFYAFAFLGFVEMFRKTKREFFFLLSIALPFVLNYGFFTHRQGFSPQARVLMPVSWVAIIAIGWFLAHNDKPFFGSAFRTLVLAGAAVTLVLLFHPSFLYQPTTHEFTERPGDLFVFLGNIRVFLPPFLPSFIKVNNAGYLPNYIWVAALLVFVPAYAFIKRQKEVRPIVPSLVVFGMLSAGFVLWVLYPRDSLYPAETIKYTETRALGLHTFPMGRGVVIKPWGDMYLHFEKRYRILFSSRRKLDEVKIGYGSEKGEYEVRTRFFDLPLFEDRTVLQKKETTFKLPAYYLRNGLYIYEIDVEIKKHSAENMLIDPYFFSITPAR